MLTAYIPTKTFLIGEYAVLDGGPAILCASEPYFEMHIHKSPPAAPNFHPQSPAGKFLSAQKVLKTHYQLDFKDPINGQGGLGASSAQFIGCYLANLYLHDGQTTALTIPQIWTMLDNYLEFAWDGEGIAPSGADIAAQALGGLCLIDKQSKYLSSLAWPFPEIECVILPTGVKLATHQHLRQLQTIATSNLSSIANTAFMAFMDSDAETFLSAINAYHDVLSHLDLVAAHSHSLIKKWQAHSACLAVKGCGALGADYIVCFFSSHDKSWQQEIDTSLTNTLHVRYGAQTGNGAFLECN